MSDNTTINGLEDSENAIRHKELGNQDFKKGHYDKAISHYTTAIGIFTLKIIPNRFRISLCR